MGWSIEQQSRLNKEWEILMKYFPDFKFYNTNSQVYIEGLMGTNEKNYYSIRLYVPLDLPNSVPEAIIIYPNPLTDYYGKRLIDYGYSATMHLLSPKNGYPKICTYKLSYWNPNRTFYNVLMKVRIWLEAFEGHKSTGNALDYYLKHEG
jgi:hypothetical protein